MSPPPPPPASSPPHEALPAPPALQPATVTQPPVACAEPLYSVASAFQEAVDAHLPAGLFAAGGTAAGLPNPLIVVRGVDGPLSWPVPPSSVAAVAAVAESTPGGGRAGSEAGGRTAGRPSPWRVAAEELSFGNTRSWPGALEGLLEDVCVGLGVGGRVRASLHSLTGGFEAGGQFPTPAAAEAGGHDTVGTLVVMLPTAHEGGSLVVQRFGQSLVFPPDTDCVSAEDALVYPTWAAYYAGCKHEVRPVTSGHRLALVYTLVRDEDREEEGAGGETGTKKRKAAVAASQAAVATADQTPIVTVLSALAMLWSSSRATAVAAGTLPPLCSRQTGWHWTTEQFGKWEYTWHINLQPPDKLLYFLDHKYPTTNGFDWTALKGRDAALVNALHRARIPAATAAAAGRRRRCLVILVGGRRLHGAGLSLPRRPRGCAL